MKLGRNKLLYNTGFYYMLTFSTYFFGFISIPYQTRIIGPEFFGLVSFSIAIAMYFKLIVDFGFILSATAKVADNSSNKTYLSEIMSAVTIIKLILSTLCLLLFLILILSSEKLNQNFLLLILTFYSVVSFSFLPDYIFRGLEKVKQIMYRTVLSQAMALLILLIFLKSPDQFLLVPLSVLGGNVASVIWSYIYLKRHLDIKFTRVRKEFVVSIFKDSTEYFYSRFATSIYSNSNILLIGYVYPNATITGIYSAADKVISLAKSALSPIADSLFPYMIKNKDYGFVKILLLVATPVLLFTSIIMWVFSNQLMTLLFGSGFEKTGEIFRILVPIISFTFYSYILGFPLMTPLRISKHANYSIIIGSIIHIMGLLYLYGSQNLSIFSIAYLTLITEFLIMTYRICVVTIAIRKGKNENYIK